MKTLKNLRERIDFFYKKKDYLTSFSIQSMYIESLVRAYSKAKIKAETGGRGMNNELVNKLVGEFGGNSKKKIADLLDFLNSVGWLNSEEKEDLYEYFNFRNTVTHNLLREIRYSSFSEDLKIFNELGQKIIKSISFLHIDPILTLIDENRSIYGKGKIYGGDGLSEENIYEALRLSLKGKDFIDISNILNLDKNLVKRIIENKLATIVEIKINLQGHKKRSKEDNRDFILKEIGKKLGVKLLEIKGSSRVTNATFARHICMYILNKVLKYSLPSTAKLLGKKDHTTVISAVRKVESLIKEGRIKLQVI
jgi:hypothetical protein